MRSYEHTMNIEASPTAVWARTVDVESWPSIFPTVTTVSRLDDGPFRINSQARIKQPGQPQRIWTVTELEPDRRFVWTARAKGFAMTATHTVTPTDTKGTTNSLRLDLNGPLAVIIAAFYGRKLREILAIENQGFRAAAMSATITPA